MRRLEGFLAACALAVLLSATWATARSEERRPRRTQVEYLRARGELIVPARRDGEPRGAASPEVVAGTPPGPVGDGVTWLEGDQNPGGSWDDTYPLLVSSTVVESLAEIDPDSTALLPGAAWVAGESAPNHDFLARQIRALGELDAYDGATATLVDTLLAARNPEEFDTGLPNWPEGGWGLAPGFETDCLTTALAMLALEQVGLDGGLSVNEEPIAVSQTNTHEWEIPDDAVEARIIIEVVDATVRLRMAEGAPPISGPFFQLPPGLWLIVFPDNFPFTPGTNYITIQNVGPAGSYSLTASYETPTFNTTTLGEPLAYLREAQNVDGGWGIQRGQPTELYTTLHVIAALQAFGNYDFETELASAISYLQGEQLGDGSFGFGGTGTPYVTALAAIDLVASEDYPFSTVVTDTIAALLAQQDVDGSWVQEPYDTALAIRALWDVNQEPDADAGTDQSVPDADDDCLASVTLDGSASSDVDGTIQAYSWRRDGVEIATGVMPTVILPTGINAIQLVVTDDGGKIGSDVVEITITSSGIPGDQCHCCLTGGECADVDALECAALGGAPSPGACLLEACCMPDASCLTLDGACCVLEGGTPIPGGTCTDPAAFDRGCCLPDGTCAMIDPLCCALEGGIAQAPGEVCTVPEACCLPDGTCSDLDPICCAEHGGTSQGPGILCVPAPQEENVEACCLPDDTCETLNPLCCVEQGGVPLGPGTQCTADEACCLPGGACQSLDPLCCELQGGVSRGAGSACGGISACCLPDDTCVALDTECCLEQGGTPHPGESCSGPVACCIGGVCSDLDPLCCADMGGQTGVGTCSAAEACCLPDDTCQLLDPECCALQGGSAQGAGTTCEPIEACCLPDDTCDDLDPLCCAAAGGTSQGPGSSCGAATACCLPDGTCDELDPLCCAASGGTSLPGESCTAAEACCIGGGCELLDPACCVEAGGTPAGTGTTCGGSEACCLGDGTCVEDDATCCALGGGSAQGAGSTCGASVACCFGDGSCSDLDAQCCLELGGLPLEPGSACEGDADMNDIDDACEGCPESNAPLPADELGESCAGDGDCANLSVCRAGVCYVPKNKFISVTPGNAGAAVGLRVRLAASSNFPAAVGNTWWVQPHDAGDPPDIFRLGCTPHYQDWSGEPGVIHIGDPEIVTDAVYDVQALDVRCDPADEDRYSDPLNLPTVGTWGDVVGPSAAGVYSPPNGAVNFDDIQAGVFGFQGNPSPPAVWVDVDPDSPNATVNFGDIQRIVQAFQGAAYPYAGPTTCP